MTNRFEPVTIYQSCIARTKEILMADIHVRARHQSFAGWLDRGKLTASSLVQASRGTGGRI
jgi:hypothetical protein